MCKPIVTREGNDIKIKHATKGTVVFNRNDALFVAHEILLAADTSPEQPE